MTEKQWELLRQDKVWAKQDLKMAETLKEYGFTGVMRKSPKKLMASFDNGPLIYELPGPICFMCVGIGDFYEIDELIFILGGGHA